MPRTENRNPCPQSPTGSGRHRWREVAGKHPAHRECSHCYATARISNNGETIYVAPAKKAA